jgi:hypothetical protein
VFKYLRYFGTHILIWVTAAGLLAAGPWCWLGLATGVVVWIGGDVFSGPVDPNPPAYSHRSTLDFALYSLFPSLVVLCLAFAWLLSPRDLLGLGTLIQTWSGRDVLAARTHTAPIDYLGASFSFALAIAMGGILTAHELTHRTRDRLAMWLGRWMLAMAFNASLEVAHVFGHHRDVGTPADPATARRGENVYHFFVRSTLGQVFQAWRIEAERWRDSGTAVRYLRNRVVHGFLRSGIVAALFFAAGGVFALSLFLLSAVWNKLLLEALNYMEHYGLVRIPGTPIEPRHSWDSDRGFCHAALFNLPWHADHHRRAGVQFPELKSASGAPKLGRGYLATLPIVLIPPLWRRLIAPELAQWDRTRASAAERALID